MAVLCLNIDLATEQCLMTSGIWPAVNKRSLNIFYNPGSAASPAQHEMWALVGC